MQIHVKHVSLIFSLKKHDRGFEQNQEHSHETVVSVVIQNSENPVIFYATKLKHDTQMHCGWKNNLD